MGDAASRCGRNPPAAGPQRLSAARDSPRAPVRLADRQDQQPRRVGTGTVKIHPGAADDDASGNATEASRRFTATLPFARALPDGCCRPGGAVSCLDRQFTMTALIVAVLVALVLASVTTVLLYNALQRGRIACDDAWSLIDVMLRRRHDLVPNLVKVVQGYAAHEQQTLRHVTEAREAAIASPDLPGTETAQAERELRHSVDSVLALAERYPDLKANAPFVKLQSELSDLESQIQASRQIYNGNVAAYRNRLQQFPSSLVAGAFHFESRPLFTADPNVDTSIAPPAEFAPAAERESAG